MDRYLLVILQFIFYLHIGIFKKKRRKWNGSKCVLFKFLIFKCRLNQNVSAANKGIYLYFWWVSWNQFETISKKKTLNSTWVVAKSFFHSITICVIKKGGVKKQKSICSINDKQFWNFSSSKQLKSNFIQWKIVKNRKSDLFTAFSYTVNYTHFTNNTRMNHVKTTIFMCYCHL